LPDIDNIGSLKNTTPINQNKNIEIKQAEQIGHINRSGIYDGF